MTVAFLLNPEPQMPSILRSACRRAREHAREGRERCKSGCFKSNPSRTVWIQTCSQMYIHMCMFGHKYYASLGLGHLGLGFMIQGLHVEVCLTWWDLGVLEDISLLSSWDRGVGSWVLIPFSAHTHSPLTSTMSK